MTATASTVRATGLYRRLQNESRAAAADPIELVTMLYDELETAIGVLGSMVRQGQRISATEPAHRARAILIGLDVNLDRDKGGDVATALSRVYRSMRRKLDEAVAGRYVTVWFTSLPDVGDGFRAEVSEIRVLG